MDYPTIILPQIFSFIDPWIFDLFWFLYRSSLINFHVLASLYSENPNKNYSTIKFKHLFQRGFTDFHYYLDIFSDASIHIFSYFFWGLLNSLDLSISNIYFIYPQKDKNNSTSTVEFDLNFIGGFDNFYLNIYKKPTLMISYLPW